jgi:hypothetical protein
MPLSKMEIQGIVAITCNWMEYDRLWNLHMDALADSPGNKRITFISIM